MLNIAIGLVLVSAVIFNPCPLGLLLHTVFLGVKSKSAPRQLGVGSVELLYTASPGGPMFATVAYTCICSSPMHLWLW